MARYIKTNAVEKASRAVASCSLSAALVLGLSPTVALADGVNDLDASAVESISTLSASDVDMEGATTLTFSDSGIAASVGTGNYTGYEVSGTDLTIKKAGTYVVSGTCADGTITVKKGVSDVVIVLDGLDLTSTDTAPICCNKSSQVTILAKDGTTSTLTDSEQNNDDLYPANEGTAENAVIKCKDGSQVTIAGTGTLNVISNGKNGIKSGSTTDSEGEAWLKIEDLNLNITANVNDAINAEAQLDIESGTVNISAVDDAIHSDYVLNVGSGDEGPTINVSSCTEGIEAATLTVNAGDITIAATDDGLNAANSDLADYSFALTINGGSLYVDAAGDGLDSNGSLTINGGTVVVYAAEASDNSPLDADGAISINGGTVLGVGYAGMSEGISGSQSYIIFGSGSSNGQTGGGQSGNQPGGMGGSMGGSMGGGNQPGGMGGGNQPGGMGGGNQPGGMGGGVQLSEGTSFAITDSSGNTLASGQAVRDSSYVIFSSDAITSGASYNLVVNGSTVATATAGQSTGGTTPGGGTAPGEGTNPGGGSSEPTPPGGGQGGGANTQTFDYTGNYSGVLVADGSSETSVDEALVSTTTDQNAVLAKNAGTATVSGATITKSGDDTDGDTCNFYGVNSSVLAVGSNSVVNISNSTISSTSAGSNGIFAANYGLVNANNLLITTTTGGNSRGLDATYRGTIVANRLTISTEKDHCASVATDRGGGYVSISNSTLSTAGSGSPLLYSTGDIEADHVTGTATGSQIAGMEGLNIIRINDSALSSTNDAKSGSDPIKDGVIIYQSTSGDADTSTSSASDFEVSDSVLSTSITSGAMFYVTNTTANVVLSNTVLNFDSEKVELLHASGNSNNWGSSGSNGGKVTFTGIGETLAGDIYVDSISSADVYLTEGSTWTGVVASSNTSGDGTTAAPGNATINVDGTSSWVVSGDTTVGSLNIASGGKVVDSTGATATIKNSAGTVLVQGTGNVTITVTGSYSTTLGTGAGSISGASTTLASARANFDELYGTSTAWNTNEDAETGYSESDETVDACTAFAIRLYTEILDREPDEAGLACQVAALKAGTPPAEIAYNFFNSSEYFKNGETAEQTVERVYQVMFGRASDEAGKAYWVGYLEEGMSVRAVVQGFSQSDEYKAYFTACKLNADVIEVFDENADKAWDASGNELYSGGNYRDINRGIAGFASRMYTECLGRDYEVNGLNVQCKALQNGMPCYQIAVNFFCSAEFSGFGLSPDETIRRCYATMLGREADDSELPYWTGRLANEGLESVVKGFCQSDEFEAICQAYGMTSGMR